MTSLVTIAVALYNNAKTLKHCIESIMHQTYNKIEIIIVDDGSTDGSAEICQKYQNVKYYYKENGGLSSARQYALNICNGEYICFVDADDYLEKDYVFKMISKCISEESDICICSTKFETANGELIVDLTDSYRCKSSKSITINKETFTNKLEALGDIFLSDSWNKMYSTKYLRNTGVSFSLTKGYNGSDLLFNNLIVMHYPKYSFVNDICYIHVIYESSATHRKGKRLQKGFEEIIQKLIDEANRLDNSYIFQKYIIRLHYRLLRKSMQDITYDSEETPREIKKRISEMTNEHKCFVDKNAYLRRFVTMDTPSLTLFYLTVEFLPFLTSIYLERRGKTNVES